MIDTSHRNRIVNKVRGLLDDGFTEIKISVFDSGFVIVPSRESTETAPFPHKNENGKIN